MDNNSTGRQRALILALDGMDWSFLQELVDAGLTPFLCTLIESGTWAPTVFPLRNCPESEWTTIATGALPDRHGILHALERLPGSAFVRSVAASSLKCPALWHHADAAGRKTAVIGWPATLGLELEHGLVASSGTEMATGRIGQAWPLHPEAVSPQSHRNIVQQLRLHPDEIRAEDLEFLLASLSIPARKKIREGLARALAENATLHAVGTYAVNDFNSDLVIVRLPFLSTVSGLLSKIPMEEGVRISLARCYQFMDLICGRYQNLLGHDAILALVSNGGTSLTQTPAAPDALQKGNGFLVLTGLPFCQDIALAPVAATEVMPTLAAALDLRIEEALDGDSIVDAFRASPGRSGGKKKPGTVKTIQSMEIERTVERVAVDLALLERERLAVPDFTAQVCFARQIECETLFSLAHVQHDREWSNAPRRRGKSASLLTLRDLLRRFPDFLAARVFLAEQLLWTGALEECESLVQTFPLVQSGGLWADVAYGLIAFARKDWAKAMAHLNRLRESGRSPINALAWLGWVFEAQTDWPEALRCFSEAARMNAHDPRLWKGLGNACFNLKRFPEAALAYGHAVSLNPRATDMLLRMSESLAKSGQPDRAASARLRAMRIDPLVTASSLQQRASERGDAI